LQQNRHSLQLRIFARPWCSVSGMTDARANARSTRWIWIAAVWCAVALFNASQTLFTMHADQRGEDPELLHKPAQPRGVEVIVTLPLQEA
jgi:hypothetical protein